MDKNQTKKLLRKYNIRPNKTMGQNFLVNENVIGKIIKAADLNKNDTILEVGPGLGILTKELVKNSKKVIAIEKDKQMIEILEQELGDCDNLEIIHRDVLDEIKNSRLKIQDYKVVANIPYYLTSHLIRTLLESENQPKEIVLLIQKEVAEKICASYPKMNLLSISVQFYAKPEIISYVSKEDFIPEPKIDSAIIKISNIKKPKDVSIENFFKLVKAGFSSKRKQLANNLSKKFYLNKEEIKTALTECHLDTQVRAERLQIENWINLLEIINFDDRDHKN